eukprot:TRINITY_DN1880_c0_g1_i2.p1 TRINITY_DN1880_c0_g1~~TRINITY_DN1880_c0_g1_i2.p1  ORF type:complete len:446 (-),score=50.36 TRINITY_DN1880_c0_g1_i2:340-1677(-)
MAPKLMVVILTVQFSLLFQEDVISKEKNNLEKLSTSTITQEIPQQQVSEEESASYAIPNSQSTDSEQPTLQIIDQKLTSQKQDSPSEVSDEIEEDPSEILSPSKIIEKPTDKKSILSSPGFQGTPNDEIKPPLERATSKNELSPAVKLTSPDTPIKREETSVKNPALNTPQKKPKTVYPYRQTVFGSQCSFPFSHGGQVYTNCLVGGDGEEYCKLDGVLYLCQPRPEHEEEEQQRKKQEPRKPPRPTSVEVRFTVSGKRCRLPLLVKNEYMTDCLFISSTQEICQAAGKWELCQPKVQSSSPKTNTTETKFTPSVTRTTKTGQICEFPVFFDGINHMDCVRMPDQREWCQVDGKWYECVAAIGNMQSDMLRMDQADKPINYQYMEEYDSMKTQSKGGRSNVPMVILGVFAVVMVVCVSGMIYGLVKMRGQHSELMQSLPRNVPKK